MPIHGYPGGVITANPTEPSQTSASGVWTTEQQLINQSAGRWPPPYYLISRSLRFNSTDTAYLSRTPASASNRKTWTWSGWVKRSTLSGTRQGIFTASNALASAYWGIEFDASEKLNIYDINSAGVLTTAAVYRDISAWYHIVVALDTTQATASNRVKLYVNGIQVTTFSAANYPPLNADSNVNSTLAHSIGSWVPASTLYFNGYMTEINFIDGQALTPSSFGRTNTDTGVWEPIAYSGTYGTNGFYLNFSDNSNTTATTLGKDYSGNGNNWTPNNFSVTAGAGNDSLVDTPTSYGTDTGVGGEVRGNYCTWNGASISADATLTNGNLDVAYGTSATRSGMMGTFGMSSGKWYWEITITASSSSPAQPSLGITNKSSASDSGTYIGANANGWGYSGSDGNKYNNASGAAYGATYATNDVIGFAFDADAGSITAYKNGVSQGVMFSSLAAGTYFPAISDGSSGITFSSSTNFGQRAFAYTAPSGFKALCTQNLPTPTIGATSTTQANRYFDVVLRNGFGSSGGSITSLNFQPDFWWEKARNNTYSHQWLDIIRGVGATGYSLSSNSTTAEVTQTNYLLSFNPNGYTLGTNDYSVATTLVDWCWKGGGTGVTNTAGTITSTVSASTTAGFSVVTYTGTGANATVGHGLGVAPQMIIIKNRQAANSWVVYHVSIGNGNVLLLNSTNASTADSTAWNTTTPTSTVFSLGSGAAADTNQTSGGGQHVAYCFAPVAGYSAFGSYAGNGSTDGPFVYTGFRPRYIMLKKSSQASTTYGWQLYDTSRSPYNQALLPGLWADTSAAEVADVYGIDILSNGFKVKDSNTNLNASGQTIIYAAFAESPFKYSLAR